MKIQTQIESHTFLSESAMIVAMWLYNNKREVNLKKLRLIISKDFKKHYTDMNPDKIFSELSTVLGFDDTYFLDSSKNVTSKISYSPTVTLAYIPRFSIFCRNFRHYIKLYSENKLVGREVYDIKEQEKIIEGLLSKRKLHTANNYTSLCLSEIEDANKRHKIAILEYMQLKMIQKQLNNVGIDLLQDERFVMRKDDIKINFYTNKKKVNKEITGTKLTLKDIKFEDERTLYLIKNAQGNIIDLVFCNKSLKNDLKIKLTKWEMEVLEKFCTSRILGYENLIRNPDNSKKGTASTFASTINKKFKVVWSEYGLKEKSLIQGVKELGKEVDYYELLPDFDIEIKNMY